MCSIRALNEILARDSTALKNKIRQMERGTNELHRCEERLRSKAFTRAQEKGVLAFDFSSHNSAVIKETRILERIQHAYLNKRDSLQAIPDAICDWLADREVHASHLESGMVFFNKYFSEYANSGSEASKLPLDSITCLRMMNASVVIVNSNVEIEKMLRHAFLASATLGADIPAIVKDTLLKSDGYFEALKEQLFSDAYVELIESLKEDYDKEKIIEMLLRTLYPKKWEDYLAEANKTLDERQRIRDEEKEWKEKFCSAQMFAVFNAREIKTFMRLSGKGLEKAIEFAKLAERGVFAEDIFMLMKIGSSAEEQEAHASANKFLAINGLCHKDISYAVASMDSEQLRAFPEKVRKYGKWVRMMPEGISIPEKQKISAALALSAEPPQNPKEAFRRLNENQQGILLQIERMKGDVSPIKNSFFGYLKHMEEVSTGTAIMKKREFVPPHDEVYFSADLRWFIGEKMVSPADVRRMLVYGLRLSSHKNLRRGKYLSATAFRDAWMVLKPSEREREIRAENAELLLRREKVILFNDDKTLVRLNVGKRGIPEEEPSEMGKEILKMVEAWGADMYPPPEEIEVEKEAGEISKVEISLDEELERGRELEALAQKFMRAQESGDRKEKTSALDALENFGEDAVPVLKEGLDDQDAEVRAFAIECLMDAVGKNAVLPFIIKLMHDEPVVQEAAAKALGEVGGKRGIWPLAINLKKGTEEVRIECARALGRLGDADALPYLKATAMADESEHVRIEAGTSLEMIKRKNSRD